jgi:hypothetical protein
MFMQPPSLGRRLLRPQEVARARPASRGPYASDGVSIITKEEDGVKEPWVEGAQLANDEGGRARALVAGGSPYVVGRELDVDGEIVVLTAFPTR